MNNHLSKRLCKLAELVPECEVFADIGCDHGILSEYIISSGKAKKVLASDISENSLAKAKERCKKNTGFFLGSGFEPLPQTPDAAVIAGMGGDEIAKIILSPKARCRLVMQPMRDSAPLYKALTENGFYIEKVCAVEDEGRIYEIISALQGKDSPFYYGLPPLDRLEIDAGALKLLYFKKKITLSAAKQAENAKTLRGEKRAEEMKSRLEKICEVIDYAESRGRY